MSKHKSYAAIFAVGALAAALASPVISASLSQLSSSPNYSEASQIVPTINGVISSINSGITPQSMGAFNSPRNVLDNGAMAVTQRGTGIQTGGTTSVPSTAYSADRWGCYANVTSGASRCQVTTSVPTPPTGFQNSQRLYRTSGALTQPVCMIQEVPTSRSTSLAGQSVIFSIYGQALAGLSADNANAANLYIFTGTGADEGLGTMTASPAITPAWTGIATTGSKAITLTTSWARYNSGVVAIPLGTTEIGVAVCFTPTATGAGTTDGLAFTGAQLEMVGANSTSPSTFEFRTYADDLYQAQRYYYQITESATVIGVRATCIMSTTSIANCLIRFPNTMRIAPTMTYATGFQASATTASSSATACTALTTTATLTGNAATPESVIMDCASTAGFGAAGTGGFLWDVGTGTPSGAIKASADF